MCIDCHLAQNCCAIELLLTLHLFHTICCQHARAAPQGSWADLPDKVPDVQILQKTAPPSRMALHDSLTFIRQFQK